MPAIRNFLRALLRHDAMNREMNEEMRFHIDAWTEELRARGLSPSDAAAAAHARFGDPGEYREHAARRAGRPSDEFAAEMTAAYRRDTDALGLGRPDSEPLATETIGEIVALIEDLVAGGHAYPADGDVAIGQGEPV